jgi:tetratricopeptide (TPR) repeat protein
MSRRNTPSPCHPVPTTPVRMRRLRLAGRIWAGLVVLVAVIGGLPRFCLWRADAALERRNEDSALAWWDRGAHCGGNARRIALGRVTAWRRKGEFDAARRALLEGRTAGVPAARLEREQWLLLAASGQMDEVEPLLPDLLAGLEPDPRDVSDAFATGFVQSARPGDALNLIAPWLADAPTDSQPHFLQGVAHAFSRSYEKAEMAFKEAARLAPHRDDVRLEWGETLLELQRPTDALAHFAAVRSPRYSSLAKFGEARGLRRTGDPARACQLLEELVASDPSNPAFWEELGRVRLDLGRSGAGIDALERGVRLAPLSVSLNEALGRALLAAGDRESGLAYLQRVQESTARLDELRRLEDASEKAPRDADLRLRIARLYAEYETPALARAWALSVLALRPDDAEAKEISVTGHPSPPPRRNRR